MPAYDYKCTECSKRFEIVHAMSERVDPACPACGGPAKKVFGAPGVAFKGSGFHNTDYRPRPSESAPCESAGSKPS